MKHLHQLMAPFLLFALVLTSQVMAGFSTPLPPPPLPPPPIYGKHTTILSIDGGGIRGIIAATVLDYLDQTLKAKDPTTSLAHYFDVIAGTSTGGIMTAMIATPKSSDPNRALFTPSEVVHFYKEKGPKIFEPSLIPSCPKYDGESLKNISRKILKDTRLNQTLTNVVIPAFDKSKIKPVIFSTYKLKEEPYLNAKLSDICIGTSAAPTYLPSHQFQNGDVDFDLVDGALAADNPALVAVSEVLQHSEHKEMLLLSLGTGKTPKKEKVSGFDTTCALEFLASNIDVVKEAVHSTNIIQYYLASVFPGVLPANNYLRIQEYDLDPSLAQIDNADKGNMDKLEKVGRNLLKQKVKRMNVNTFIPVILNQTNAEALDRFAEKLYAERQLRLKRQSMTRRRRPFIKTVKVHSAHIQAI